MILEALVSILFILFITCAGVNLLHVCNKAIANLITNQTAKKSEYENLDLNNCSTNISSDRVYKTCSTKSFLASGQSVLEVMVSLLIISPVLVAATATLKSTSSISNSISLNLENYEKELQAITAVKNIVSAVDTININASELFLQQQTSIKNIDGFTLNLSSQLNIKPGSSGLTYARFLTEGISLIKSEETDLVKKKIIACTFYQQQAGINSDIKAVALLSIDGIQELVLSETPIKQTNGCYVFKGNYQKSALFKDNWNSYNRILIPINEIITLYLANNNDLRILQHVGSSVIESQPILSGIKNFNINVLTQMPIWQIEALINNKSYILHSKILREPYFNILTL